MKDKESRIIFKNDELILVNPKKPVCQMGFEMIVLGMIVSKN